MFFKKQAFKLKDLLKDSGIDVPLVTVQEMLAKSYGFNNRHVALNNEEFHQRLEKVVQNPKKENHLEKGKKECDTPLNKLPKVLRKSDINDYRFWWNEPGDDFAIHNQDTSPGDPFEEDYLHKDLKLYLYEKEDDSLKYSFVTYQYYPATKSFNRENVIKNYMKNRAVAPFFKNFDKMDINVSDIHYLLKNSVDWLDEIKRILQHKDCPVDVLKIYSSHQDFYVRVVAIFSKRHRTELSYLAKMDKDSRVRAVYYKNLLVQYRMTESDIIRNKIYNEMSEDSANDVVAMRYFKNINQLD